MKLQQFVLISLTPTFQESDKAQKLREKERLQIKITDLDPLADASYYDKGKLIENNKDGSRSKEANNSVKSQHKIHQQACSDETSAQSEHETDEAVDHYDKQNMPRRKLKAQRRQRILATLDHDV